MISLGSRVGGGRLSPPPVPAAPVSPLLSKCTFILLKSTLPGCRWEPLCRETAGVGITEALSMHVHPAAPRKPVLHVCVSPGHTPALTEGQPPHRPPTDAKPLAPARAWTRPWLLPYGRRTIRRLDSEVLGQRRARTFL